MTKTKQEIEDELIARIKPNNNKKFRERHRGMGIPEDGVLTTYRRLVEVGNSGNYVVQEGYVKHQELPNGDIISREINTAQYPVEWAIEND